MSGAGLSRQQHARGYAPLTPSQLVPVGRAVRAVGLPCRIIILGFTHPRSTQTHPPADRKLLIRACVGRCLRSSAAARRIIRKPARAVEAPSKSKTMVAAAVSSQGGSSFGGPFTRSSFSVALLYGLPIPTRRDHYKTDEHNPEKDAHHSY